MNILFHLLYPSISMSKFSVRCEVQAEPLNNSDVMTTESIHSQKSQPIKTGPKSMCKCRKLRFCFRGPACCSLLPISLAILSVIGDNMFLLVGIIACDQSHLIRYRRQHVLAHCHHCVRP